MEHRPLGRAGVKVSPVALGTVNFSWLTDEAESFAMMDRALELGVNFFDTSNNYNAGQTEALIGRWLAQGGGRREHIVLATKVYSKPNEWGAPDPAKRTGEWVGPNDHGLSARHIRAAVEASLTRLQTDHIDLYQTHHVDRAVRFEELWQAMELLVAQGKVIYVGSSNYAGWHIAKAQEAAKCRGFLGFVSEQSVYNLANRQVELEVIPACEAYGLGFVPYSPLAGGQLGGRSGADAGSRRAFMPKSAKADAYQALCDELGLAPADVAVAWVAQQPGVTAPIIGPRTMAQLEANVAAAQLQLDASAIERLDELFPGPGGPAPEAYAW